MLSIVGGLVAEAERNPTVRAAVQIGMDPGLHFAEGRLRA